MKKICLIVMALVLVAGIAGCGKSVHKETAEQWLNSLAKGSRYQVGGQWKGPQAQGFSPYSGFYDATFGPIVLIQEGDKLSGTYAEYEVIGRISGDKVFLVGVYDDVVYYTWHFRYAAKAKSLIGKMCDGYYPVLESHCYPLTLERVAK
jgi:hypothetical protein